MPKRERLSALDLAEALHLAHATATLHDLGVLASLPATAEALARKHRLDPTVLRGTLDYLAARTDLIRKRVDVYSATRNYAREARFLLDLYALAYAPNAIQLAGVLRKPKLGADLVDRKHHARAFEDVRGPSPLANVAKQLQLNHVLDLGCGTGATLRALADDDPSFAGWGLELNPAMCTAARATLRGTNVRILRGDARDVRTSVPIDIRKQVRAVMASQLANEMFGDGSRGAVRWLRHLRRAFPDRPLLLSDYYGLLGRGAFHRETWLHDYAQLISGQGIPPANHAEWSAIYDEAGYRLAHVIEDSRTTLFVHLVV